MKLSELKKEVEQADEIAVRSLEKWADSIGDKPYFYYGEASISYSFKEFNELANSIGHHLLDLGIQKGDRVSLYIKNPLVCSLMMFGIWKAGAVYCPINFNYFGKLLSYQINDTSPTVLVTEDCLIPNINEIKNDIHIKNLKVIVHSPKVNEHDYLPEFAHSRLDKSFQEIPFTPLLDGNRSNVHIELNYWDTSNIIYTSGTTGPSKGVVQSHRWNYVCTFTLGKILNHDDVIYNDLPLYHMAGAIQCVTRAAYAGCMVAVWDKFSPNKFWDRIKESGATNAILVDVMMPWLLKAKETPFDRYNTLNKVYVQPLPKSHHKLAKRFGFDFVMAGYGQTEAGHGCVTFIKELDEDNGTPKQLFKGRPRDEIVKIAERYGVPVRDGNEELKKGYMGKPSVFKEISIVDENDRECKSGEIGQIVYRPRLPYAILTEYFGKPEATLETSRNFWFHTGDAGYMDEEGQFYFVDRMGTVIRVKGENISSYQVEDILIDHPGVELCAVFPIPAEEGDEDDVVAFVVPKENEGLKEDDLHAWTAEKMPKYMRPKYIRIIDEVPRTPTNKIEKYKLKQKILQELSDQSNAIQK
jgi:carnitine-CoA ligase